MLEFRDVGMVYPTGTQAVADINLSVPESEFCVLLGPSGAGKSTLLGMINGLNLPTQGSVSVGGELVTRKRLKAIQRRVGMIHQQLHIVGRLPVLHNVLAGALPEVSTWRSLLGLFPTALQRKACALLQQVELEEQHLYRRASLLSGGQQQRVAIARAFILDPDVVLADEPVASLDPAISRGILALLKRASKSRNTTVVCSLHQVELALEFADRIVGLRQGRVVYDGSPNDIGDAVLSQLYERDARPTVAAAVEA